MAVVDDRYPVAKEVRLLHVVGGEEDGGVMGPPQFADELLDPLLGAVRKARVIATFCCIPRDICCRGWKMLARFTPKRSGISINRSRAYLASMP